MLFSIALSVASYAAYMASIKKHNNKMQNIAILALSVSVLCTTTIFYKDCTEKATRREKRIAAIKAIERIAG